MQQIAVTRKKTRFTPDSSRVIARFLCLSDKRSADIIKLVLAMSEHEVNLALIQLLRGFSQRHRSISRIFSKHFEKLVPLLKKIKVNINSLSESQKTLIGSYFTMEYSIESAALFNPSIVEHPDQSQLRLGDKRVILSFRATGEGHVSSIVFRTGILDKDNDINMEPSGKMLAEADKIIYNIYKKNDFEKRLVEIQEHLNIISPAISVNLAELQDPKIVIPSVILGIHDQKRFHGKIISPDFIFDKLGKEFTYTELKKNLELAIENPAITADQIKLINLMLLLASSNYEINFSIDSAISERVIFPITISEEGGIEDARFVKFTDDDGEVTYYATYTAYDRMDTLPKLMSTKDFYNFKILSLNGEVAKNKGMALFPRKINGKYAMLCRIDGFNNYLAYSDNLNIWNEAKIIQKPKFPWEFVQIGNAGSPIETEDGWLVITHSVGPMREYSLGASLYDLKNPEIEIGRLNKPLMVPSEIEREGYVPNVIYSCGSIIHNNNLVIPYAMSDLSSSFATVNLRELLNILKDNSKETANGNNK
jgi:predicted GH43/DUF377 family glycosyl hydrolase